MDILYYTSLEEPSPFWGIIGSLYPLQNDDIYIRYSEFYDEFLQSFDLTKSLERLFQANPNRPQEYSFVNAPELFRVVYKNYLKTQFTSDAIKKGLVILLWGKKLSVELISHRKRRKFLRVNSRKN